MCDLCATLARRSLLNYVKFFGAAVAPTLPDLTQVPWLSVLLGCCFCLVAGCFLLFCVRQVRVQSLSFWRLFCTAVATGCTLKLKNLLCSFAGRYLGYILAVTDSAQLISQFPKNSLIYIYTCCVLHFAASLQILSKIPSDH